MSVKNLLIVILLFLTGWLGWTTLNLAIENDGLRQVTAEHRQSIESLLDYVSVATKCDVTPQELSAALGAAPAHGSTNMVSHLAFQARFNDRGIADVGVVGVKRIFVCQAK